MRSGEVQTGLGAALSAIIALLCCVSPIILAMLGLGSAVAAATLMRFQWVFVAVAAVVVLISFSSYRRKKRPCAREGRVRGAGWLVAFMLYFSALLVAVLGLGLIFPDMTYIVLKFFFG